MPEQVVTRPVMYPPLSEATPGTAIASSSAAASKLFFILPPVYYPAEYPVREPVQHPVARGLFGLSRHAQVVDHIVGRLFPEVLFFPYLALVLVVEEVNIDVNAQPVLLGDLVDVV